MEMMKRIEINVPESVLSEIRRGLKYLSDREPRMTIQRNASGLMKADAQGNARPLKPGTAPVVVSPNGDRFEVKPVIGLGIDANLIKEILKALEQNGEMIIERFKPSIDSELLKSMQQMLLSS